MSDMRASELGAGMTYRDYGSDETYTIRTIGMHGDTVLVTTTDGTELTLDRDEVVDHQPVWTGKFDEPTKTHLPEFTKDVTGKYFGGAYWDEAEYRVTIKTQDGVPSAFLLTVEDSSGAQVCEYEFSDTQAEALRRMVSTSEDADDDGLGLVRELHWHVGDDRNEVDLDMNFLEDVRTWLDFAFGDEVWDGGEVWEF